jgi:branched-chain amino acid transport system permease protein
VLTSYQEGILILLGINILLGWSVYLPLATAQASIGNAGFMAIGAYVSSYLTLNFGCPIFLALIIGGLTASIVGLLLGLPALRLRGIYLVMGTLAFGEMVRNIFLNWEFFGGAYGMRGMKGTSLALVYFWVFFGVFSFYVLSRARLRLTLDSIFDDEIVSQLTGTNIVRIKVGVFGFGALLAGIAGGLYAHYMRFIEPGNFSVLLSVYMLLFVILGGMRTHWGAVLGAAVFTLVPEISRGLKDYRGVFFGGLIIALMILRPKGLITRDLIKMIFLLPKKKDSLEIN